MSHPDDSWRHFWAKTDRDNRDAADYDPTWTRPLWAHLLDVGHAALLLWERAVPDVLRRGAADALSLTDPEAGRWLSFWIGLHDLGKATPSFQFLEPGAPYLKKLKAEGFTLSGSGERGPHHGHATTALVFRELNGGAELRADAFDAPLSFKESLAAFVGFHHGRLLNQRQWRGLASGYDALGDARWADQQRRLLGAVRGAWAGRYGLATPRVDLAPTPDWLLGLAGWATYADWLGSLAEAFPGKNDPDDPARLGGPDAYLDASRAGAERALARAGVDARAALVARPFGDLFPALAGHPPRPAQRALLDLPLPADRDAPTLTVLEAPTGEGKTEGALALAARQQDRAGRDRPGDPSRGGGLYLALPTKATANGLLDRATTFLEQAHDGPLASFRLAYGRAELHPDARALLADPGALAALYDESDPTPADARVRTLGWFLGRKRALLAPYGLGTLDQGLLGVLYARHFFLRLFGLAGKTVVVDEVHAYDVYTGTLLLRLLPWLRALGCHVVLLSATLPARARRELLTAWDPDAPLPDEPDPAATGYPAVWTSAEGAVRRRAGEADGLTASRTQRAELARADAHPEAVASLVAAAVADGAAVAVVCNTVARAQRLFEVLQATLEGALAPGDLVLFHARFVQRERAEIERRALARFGKGRPPGPAVLVGTQVIEQSLDLDVDLMLSDLAPVDLLLQRAGRLHRHDRDDRPLAHAVPRLWWLCPDWEPGDLPNIEALSGRGHVYRRTALWRTALLLRDRRSWSLPDDYRPLIEAVYGHDDPPAALSDASRSAWATRERREADQTTGSERNASRRLIPPPDRLGRMLIDPGFELAADDDEEAHESMKALTREGDSVEVVVLHADAHGALFLDPDHRTPAPLPLPAPKKALRPDAVRQILGATVRLSTSTILRHLRQRPDADLPDGWVRAAEATPSLRGLLPVVMRDRVWDAAGPALRWDDALGLVLDYR